jgi:hypothetical protein
VFRKHQWLYFKQTDLQISDSRHHFNGLILPERAGGTPDLTQYYVYDSFINDQNTYETNAYDQNDYDQNAYDQSDNELIE